MPEETGKIIFQYKGEIYNRPMGRGIAFVQPDGIHGILYNGEIRDLYLEDIIPDGNYEVEIIIRERNRNV
jgi:hypothetical protein